MSATVATYIWTGGGVGAGAIATNIRLKLADNNTQDTNNPNVRPAAGVNYSFWKSMVLHAVTPPDTGINNVKLFTDEALAPEWDDCIIWVGDETSGTYQQATGAGDSGAEMVANHAQITGRTNLFSFGVGAPKDISGSIGYATGRISDYVVLQGQVGPAASGGHMPYETLTWRYDET